MPALSEIWKRTKRAARGTVLAAALLAVGGSAAFLASKASAPGHAPAAPKDAAEQAAKIRRDGADAVLVPDALARNMGLRTAPAAARTRQIPLPPLQGTLAIDTNRLARVPTRFAGEVVALGTRPEEAYSAIPAQPPATQSRPLRVGDAVRQGELLAVVWSKDLGEKKSELVNALSQLRADEVTRRRLDEGFRTGSIPERSLRDAERAVAADRVAVDKAERTLRSWRLGDDEIAAVRAEADRLGDPAARRPDPADWARVEVRAPQDGVVLEKNVSTVGQWVDPTVPLFQIGDLSHLVVWAHLYEEDLPLVQALPRPVRWVVRVPSRPGAEFPGTLDQVGAVIDPNQHTALVTGRVENPGGELKVGQAVTVSLNLPPPPGEIELPADAVVEDGRESVVFVRPAGTDGRYVRTPVRVTSRFRDVVCVRAGGGVNPGDAVVTGGALLLRDAMDQAPPPSTKSPDTPVADPGRGVIRSQESTSGSLCFRGARLPPSRPYGPARREPRPPESRLIGGDDQDLLTAGAGDSILVGGAIAFDGDPAALLQISTGWTSTASDNDRVAALKAGANGVPKLDPAAVTAAGAKDDLFVGPGPDWFVTETPDVVHGAGRTRRPTDPRIPLRPPDRRRS